MLIGYTYSSKSYTVSDSSDPLTTFPSNFVNLFLPRSISSAVCPASNYNKINEVIL